MKKILNILIITLCAFFVTSCISTDAATDASSVTIIDVPGKTAAEIYTIANFWAIDAFNSADAVMEFTDPQIGTIKWNYTIELEEKVTGSVLSRTVITIDVKDNKARISFTNPVIKYHRVTMGPVGWIPCTVDTIDNLKIIWTQITESLRNELTKNTDEW